MLSEQIVAIEIVCNSELGQCVFTCVFFLSPDSAYSGVCYFTSGQCIFKCLQFLSLGTVYSVLAVFESINLWDFCLFEFLN